MNGVRLGFLFVVMAATACSSGDDSLAQDAGVDQSVNDVANDVAAKDAASDAAANDASDAAATDASDAASDASDAGTTSDGSVTACHTCSQTDCTSQIQACALVNACQQWLQCVNNCSAPACESACDSQYPTAKTDFDAVYSCSCTSCNAECGNNLAPCTHGQDGGA